MKAVNARGYIFGKVIKNLLYANKRIAEKGDAKAIIALTKFILKISKEFDDELLYLGLEECNESTEKPPKKSENQIESFE